MRRRLLFHGEIDLKGLQDSGFFGEHAIVFRMQGRDRKGLEVEPVVVDLGVDFDLFQQFIQCHIRFHCVTRNPDTGKTANRRAGSSPRQSNPVARCLEVLDTRRERP